MTEESRMEMKTITSGKVRRTDFVLDSVTNKMVHPSNEDYKCLGSNVESYFLVQRIQRLNS